MILNKREYLKQVFSLDLSYETEEMIAARRDYLEGNAQGTSNNSLSRRQELYWQLQEFRYEFWTLSAKQRESKIDELSKQAPQEFKISLDHLQQVSALEEEVKKLEKDLDFDPLFVERLKSRLLWSDNSVPGELELRTAIPTQRLIEFTRIQESVSVLKERYPPLAQFVPQWLAMIETSQVTLIEGSSAPGQYAEKKNERSFNFNSSHQFIPKEEELDQAEEDEKIEREIKESEESAVAVFVFIIVGFSLLYLFIVSA